MQSGMGGGAMGGSGGRQTGGSGASKRSNANSLGGGGGGGGGGGSVGGGGALGGMLNSQNSIVISNTISNALAGHVLDPMTQQQLQSLSSLAQFHNLTLDPSALSSLNSSLIKQELDLDPTDPFNFSHDFNDLLAAGGGPSHAADTPSTTAMTPLDGLLSPLSASPLEKDYFSRSLSSSYGVSYSRYQPTPGTSVPDSTIIPSDLSSFQSLEESIFAPSTPSSQSLATPSSLRPSLRRPDGLIGSATSKKPSSKRSNPPQPSTAASPAPSSSVSNSGGPGAFFSTSLPVTASGFADLEAAGFGQANGSAGGGSSLLHPGAASLTRPAMTMPPHMLGQQPQQRQRAVSASSSTTAGVGASLASSLSSTTSTGKVSKASGSGVTKRSMGAVTSVDDLEAKQAKPTTNRADINEKRRRRRESHNAVERRRRDNINEKIQELSSLLPDFGSDVQNKGSILRRSVEYIKMMQALASRQQERMTELENVCQLLLQRCGMEEHELLLTVPLGTVFELPQLSGVTVAGGFGGIGEEDSPLGGPLAGDEEGDEFMDDN